MAGKDLRAKIRLEGDPTDANAAIKSVDSRFKRLGKSIRKSALAQVAILAGVAIAFRGLVRGIKAVVSAANVQEDAISELDRALASLGPTSAGVSKRLQEQAAALQQTTIFGDETIIKSQALIASFVKEESQIKAATKATLDLAAAKGFDLVTAADLISKTLGSSTNALTRYGIEVTGAVGSTERLTTLTTNIARVFGGAAAKQAETFSGKVKTLGNTFGDLQEEMGFAITKSEDIGEALDNLNTNLQDVTPQMRELTEGVVDFALSLVNGLVDMGQFIGELATLVDGTGDLAKASEDSAVAQKALNETAFRLRITVEALELKLAGTVVETRSLNRESQAAAKALEEVGEEAETAADRLKRLDDEATAASDAMVELGKAIGIVTSQELAGEIAKIEAALEVARIATGGFGREFEQAQLVADAAISTLKARIVSLQSGLGDLEDQTEDATEALDEFGDASVKAGGKVGELTGDLAAQARQADVTAAALTRLTGVAESLALAEARTALARTQAERSGLRGVSSQRGDPSVGAYTGLPVGPGTSQTYIVNPDGSLRPA